MTAPRRECGVSAVIDVAAVDDHPIVLDAVAGWVMAAESGIRVVAVAATVDALLAGPGRQAHVVLLDLDLGDGTTEVLTHQTNVPVMFATPEGRAGFETSLDRFAAYVANL